ncbi:MAG: tRNA pseudouridine(38-40) synthase TruA [Desulfosudaceae bacterium]
MANFKLTIEYDGSGYHGWQRQKGDVTIQETLEEALATMAGQPVKLAGSGRTDAGVHALAQTASFHCQTRLRPENFKNGLNSLLPDDIVVTGCELAPDDFHARYSAVKKTYHYWIFNHPEPTAIWRRYVWHIRQPLNVEAMKQALAMLVGEHDFKSFESSGSPRSSTVRRILEAAVTEKRNSCLRIEITADGFLRYMVRNIIGTLAEIGRGKRAAATMPTVLAARDRSRAGATAPAGGLFLVKVFYAGEVGAGLDNRSAAWTPGDNPDSPDRQE